MGRVSLKDFILVEDHESAQLMRASAQHGPVEFSFGPGWVGLRKNTHPWAEKLLRQWRGQDYDEGGGI